MTGKDDIELPRLMTLAHKTVAMLVRQSSTPILAMSAIFMVGFLSGIVISEDDDVTLRITDGERLH